MVDGAPTSRSIEKRLPLEGEFAAGGRTLAEAAFLIATLVAPAGAAYGLALGAIKTRYDAIRKNGRP